MIPDQILVEEKDGTPAGSVWKIKFPNGSITDITGGVMTYGGGGTITGPLTIEENSQTVTISHDGTNAKIDWSVGDLYLTGDIVPSADNTLNLGSASLRWANIYVADLNLRNDRGDWTLIEEAEYLTVRNNKTGKLYRLLMEEI
jgi:hypothetical protein